MSGSPFSETQSVPSTAHESGAAASVEGVRKDAERGVATPPAGKDPYLVDLDVGDLANPQNWSMAKRWYLTALGGILVLNACVTA